MSFDAGQVRSLLTTVHYRREFLNYRQKLHQRQSQTGGMIDFYLRFKRTLA